jgi:hypothetical protein
MDWTACTRLQTAVDWILQAYYIRITIYKSPMSAKSIYPPRSRLIYPRPAKIPLCFSLHHAPVELLDTERTEHLLNLSNLSVAGTDYPVSLPAF